jgi:glycosyltransferase involved in cell wall biosynthesis
MPKLLTVSVSINSTSTGRIAEEIGIEAERVGFDVTAAYGYVNNNSSHNTIKIGNGIDHYAHALFTRLTDRHGYGSVVATQRFVKRLKELKPDVVNLHNLHGYYLNIEILIEALREMKVPVVWTMHDCWSFTGHCPYFDAVGCDRWKTGCHDCPNKHCYPASYLIDNSRQNYARKRSLFSSLEDLTIVAPCNWMADNIRKSFLGNRRIEVIYNGVNTEVFKPCTSEAVARLKQSLGLDGKRIILGVAILWDMRKRLDDFIRLSERLADDSRIVVIGLSEKQTKNLPSNIIGIVRTENVEQLAQYYSMADVFVNVSIEDNFPTTNIEALACGTPVVTYNTGGSPEAIDESCGAVCEQDDIDGLLSAINRITAIDRKSMIEVCRSRALRMFDSRERFADYAKLLKNCCRSDG